MDFLVHKTAQKSVSRECDLRHCQNKMYNYIIVHTHNGASKHKGMLLLYLYTDKFFSMNAITPLMLVLSHYEIFLYHDLYKASGKNWDVYTSYNPTSQSTACGNCYSYGS